MKITKLSFLLCLVWCGFLSPQPMTSEEQHLPQTGMVVLLPRRLDYDVLIASVNDRVAQLSNHKYWQGLTVVGGAAALTAAWYFWPKDNETPPVVTPVEQNGNDTKTTTVVDRSPDGAIKTTITQFGLEKEKPTFFKKTGQLIAKDFRRIFVGAIAALLVASGQKILGKVFYWWDTPNKVFLYSALFRAAKNGFDSCLLRKPEGFTIADTEIIENYNRALRSLQQFVVELSAQTLFLARKSGAHVEDAVELLLKRFSRDVDAANKKICEATEPFSGDDARCSVLLKLAIDSVVRLEELYDGFVADQTVDDESSSTRSTRGARRG